MGRPAAFARAYSASTSSTSKIDQQASSRSIATRCRDRFVALLQDREGHRRTLPALQVDVPVPPRKAARSGNGRTRTWRSPRRPGSSARDSSSCTAWIVFPRPETYCLYVTTSLTNRQTACKLNPPDDPIRSAVQRCGPVCSPRPVGCSPKKRVCGNQHARDRRGSRCHARRPLPSLQRQAGAFPRGGRGRSGRCRRRHRGGQRRTPVRARCAARRSEKPISPPCRRPAGLASFSWRVRPFWVATRWMFSTRSTPPGP